ncbi:unnamed protein product [Effrenium voratum]|uniref:Uncharacterized protein n=1 Tax=Effrenium voratum TaxID=2562239 RepID=A0AA36MM27_9DINO|nr:unnamed protein product [Effrenium voratum]
MLDSAAEFEARATEVGILDAELTKLKAMRFHTFGRLAFASKYVPGQSDDGPLKVLASKITGEDPAPDDRLPVIRRLVFEACTLAAADMRTRLERKDGDAPRCLAHAERTSRYTEQCKRLKGLELPGELEPSHRLIDIVFQMAEEGQLRYVRWEECTKRDQELMGLKSDPVWKPDASGVIKETKVAEVLKADYNTDLKLKFALQRRSLAFDQARLVDYEEFEKWSQVLLEACTSPPPEGYNKPNIEQVHRADLELFKFMMRETRSGIKAVNGVQPLDKALKTALQAPAVRLCLQPLQGKRRNDSHEDEPDKKKPKDQGDGDRLKRTIENLQGQIRNLKAQSSNQVPAKKGRGKGKGKINFIRLPPSLIGLSPTTPSGEPCCYDFNLPKGCKAARPWERCEKGFSTQRHRDLCSWSTLRTSLLIRILQHVPRRGAPRSQPLRSAKYPHGLPNLTNVQLQHLGLLALRYSLTQPSSAARLALGLLD